MKIDLFGIFCVLYILWVMSKFAKNGKVMGSKVYTWKKLGHFKWTKAIATKQKNLSEF